MTQWNAYLVHATDVVGYTADADCFCIGCAVRAYPAIEIAPTVAVAWPIEDSEGNEVRPIFASDEAGDTPTHCGECGELIDDSWSASTVEYAEERVREYLETGRGNRDVLAAWIEHAHPWAGFDPELAETFLASES